MTVTLYSTEASGQKTTIDLLPSSHQSIHPEAIIDPNFQNDSLLNMEPNDRSSTMYSEDKEKKRIFHRESRRTGFQIDSVFKKSSSYQKGSGKNNRTIKSTGKTLLILKNFNPIKFIMHITALKI